MIDAGVDVFRLNMSHGEHEEHADHVAQIRSASRECNRIVGILCDISGPKIRLGKISPEPITLRRGDTIALTAEEIVGSPERISVNYAGLTRAMKPGGRLLLDDGLLEFEVTEVRENELECVVVRGGPLSSHKGVNLPHTSLDIGPLTDKDHQDIQFMLAQDIDFFAISFVKSAEDIRRARAYIESAGGSLPIIAKIEKFEAVSDLEEILREADGAMVARGDLGVEIPLEQVPIVQKRLIAICNELGKPVITATQMLDSMIRFPRPTRAEVNDVANAILDGTDAVMLSAETATGDYPVLAVEMMDRIARATEPSLDFSSLLRRKMISTPDSIPDAISHATAHIVFDLKLASIVCLTQSGSTARMAARYRPDCPVLAYTPIQRTAQQLCLSWGVKAVTGGVTGATARRLETEFEEAIEAFVKTGDLKAGDQIVLTAGIPLREPGTTNLLRVLDVN
jgi:pyruvate kinase